MRTKFMILWIEKKFFFRFLDFKSTIEKCVGCFLIYIHFRDLYFLKKVLVNDAFSFYRVPCPD